MDEILDITVILAETFERLGVPYLVGGSLASSLHGMPRSTLDVDFLAQVTQHDVAPFVDELRGKFYFDADAIREAVDSRRSFNVIHLGSYFKADVFVARDTEADRLQMDRRERHVLGETPRREIVVASAEDVVAQKLAWFVLGGEVSNRQWDDAIGVLKVAALQLDFAYLRRAASLLGVAEHLERAIREAGIQPNTSDA